MALKRALASFFPFLFSILGVAKAAQLENEIAPYLLPFFDVVTLVLGKNVDSIAMFYLIIILGIFIWVITYTALKRSGSFADTFTSNGAEAAIAILITLLTIRFMPFAYFFFMLLAFLVVGVILAIRTIYALVADEEHEFGAISGLFVISVGTVLLGSLILLFNVEIAEAGVTVPPEVGGIASFIIFIGALLLLITIGLGIYKVRGTVKEAWKDIKEAETLEKEGDNPNLPKRKRLRFLIAEAKVAKRLTVNLRKQAKELKKKAGAYRLRKNREAAQIATRAGQIASYADVIEEKLVSKIERRNALKRKNPDKETKGLDSNIFAQEEKIEGYLADLLVMKNKLRIILKNKKSPARTRKRKSKTRKRPKRVRKSTRKAKKTTRKKTTKKTRRRRKR